MQDNLTRVRDALAMGAFITKPFDQEVRAICDELEAKRRECEAARAWADAMDEAAEANEMVETELPLDEPDVDEVRRILHISSEANLAASRARVAYEAARKGTPCQTI